MINPDYGSTPGTLNMRGLDLGRVCLEITHATMTESTIVVYAHVAERDEQVRPYVEVTFRCERPPGLSDAVALRHALHKFVCHEIDEHIYSNGVRVFDPHVHPYQIALYRP